MKRRAFLSGILGAVGARVAAGACGSRSSVSEDRIMTVRGPIPPARLGSTLPHEHILVDFAGAENVGRDRYDRTEVFETVLPHLKQVASTGCQTLVECTPMYLGRDAVLLRRLADAADLNILTNTGYYGANDDHHVPEHAYAEGADELAERWTREWDRGIDDTGIRPGFIKIGVDSGSLSAIDEKLVRAACRTHRKTGLTIAAHTGAAEPAFEELAVLADEGIDPSAWIWVHAQNEDDLSRHTAAAARGAWVEFDGFNPEQTGRYVEMVSNMKAHDLLDRTLISQDNGWYHVGEPGGGTFQPYDQLHRHLLPALKQSGFTDGEIRRLTVTNPKEAFTVGVRTAVEN